MRLLFAAFAALFVFAALLQYNDPDPVRWMALYLFAAVTAGLAALSRPLARPLSALVGIVALVWAAIYVPAVLRHGQFGSMFEQWSMRDQAAVENREFFGLLIVTGAMATVWFTRRPERRSRSD